jgi:intein-encoded DNA endonuclease-like protein
LVNGRRDLADIAAAINRDFYQTFLDAEGESVAGRTRLAEAATATLEQERIGVEANVLAIQDLINVAKVLLARR